MLRNELDLCKKFYGKRYLQCENGSCLVLHKASNSRERLKVLNTLLQPYEAVKQLRIADQDRPSAPFPSS
jgi:hypothetical protein